MEQNIEMDNDHIHTTVAVRPTSLKNVCILSFLMCAFMIFTQLWGLKIAFFPSQQDIMMQQQQLEIMKAMNPDGSEAMMELVSTKGTTALFNLFIQTLSLLGVFMMWRLNKNGFYIYVFAELIYYIISILFSGFSSLSTIASAFGNGMESLIWISMAFTILIDLFFISIYYRNLKYMS